MNSAWETVTRWLGVGSSRVPSPEEFDTTIQPAWQLPVIVPCLLILAAAIAVASVYWHERNAGRSWKFLLAGIRTLLVTLAVLLLYGWTAQRHRIDRTDLVVMLDDSASMDIADAGAATIRGVGAQHRLSSGASAGPTRLNRTKSLLLDNDAALLRELQRRYNMHGYFAGETARAWPADEQQALESLAAASATQMATRLGDLLAEVLEAPPGRPPAAVILLTDGIVTDGQPLPAAAEVAGRRGVPLFLVGVGSERPPRDLHLSDLVAPRTAFVGDWLSFEVKVAGEGYTGPAAVALKSKGSGQTLAQQAVALDGSKTAHMVRLSHRAEAAGEFQFVVEVAPQPGEVNAANNSITHQVVVQEAAIRVLLVQAYPSYEFRFLKQMLARELNTGQTDDNGKSPGVRTVLQQADPGYVATDNTAEAAFPASREELFSYDVVIFGDVDPALLSAAMIDHLYDFVTVHGGGLIFIAGPRYTPWAYRGTRLAPLFPVNLGSSSVPDANAALPAATPAADFRPRLTALGLRSPALQLADRPEGNETLWRDELAPLRWFASTPDLRPAAQVLAEHPVARSGDGRPLPVICQQFAGAGKVVFQATDETHRWRYRVGDLYFARYWVQTIRSLCRANRLTGNREVELTTDRQRYRRGESAQLRLRFFDDRRGLTGEQGISVIVQNQRGERRSVRLDRHALDRALYEGSTGPLAEGEYGLRAVFPGLEGEAPTQSIVVTGAPGELAHTQADANALRAAARASGGRFYTPAAAGRLLEDLPRARQVRTESLAPTPIWNSPLVAGVFIGLLTIEWALRKRAGML